MDTGTVLYRRLTALVIVKVNIGISFRGVLNAAA